jgi:hypothetical protein
MIQEPKMPCIQLVARGERELAAFIRSVTESFGVEQARVATEDWLEAVTLLDCDSPRPSHSWRLITIAATTQFVHRVTMPSSDKSRDSLTKLCEIIARHRSPVPSACLALAYGRGTSQAKPRKCSPTAPNSLKPKSVVLNQLLANHLRRMASVPRRKR